MFRKRLVKPYEIRVRPDQRWGLPQQIELADKIGARDARGGVGMVVVWVDAYRTLRRAEAVAIQRAPDRCHISAAGSLRGAAKQQHAGIARLCVH